MRTFLVSGLILVFTQVVIHDCCSFALVQEGRSKCNIICISSSESVRSSAIVLAEYLKKITDANFDIIDGDGTSDLAVGLVTDFPKLGYISNSEFEYRQAYSIRSHSKGIHLIGQTPQAVEYAVWDFLYRLGYRQYFPDDVWEIIPHKGTLEITVDVNESPDFLTRTFWPGGGFWKDTKDLAKFELWLKKNRMGHPLDQSMLIWGHIYNTILKEKKHDFEVHPEYLAMVEGKRELRLESGSQKFCSSNTGLQKLVVDWAVDYFFKFPNRRSISMEPSDGDDWCQCDNCRNMGSPSDRAVFIANLVATEVNKKYGTKYITLYAYNVHGQPPLIKLHPQIVVGVATWFIPPNYTFDQVFFSWKNMGGQIGIREYLSVIPWSRDLPGELSGNFRVFRARGGDLNYIKATIPLFYENGARYYHSEMGYNWLPNGLGYYVASRLLWDTEESKNTDLLVSDFLEKAFGKVSEPMDKYYNLIYSQHDKNISDNVIIGRKGTILNNELIRKMYQYSIEAWEKSSDPIIKNRISQAILYNKYVELYMAYLASSGNQRQMAFEDMLKFSYRSRYTNIVASLATYRDAITRDSTINIPEQCQWFVAEDDNPWKNSNVFAKEEIQCIIDESRKRYDISKKN